MNTTEIRDKVMASFGYTKPYSARLEMWAEVVDAAIEATLDAIRELPAEITDSSASLERDFALKWYSRIDALKREVTEQRPSPSFGAMDPDLLP